MVLDLNPVSSLFGYLRKAVIAVIFLSKYYLVQTSLGHHLYCRFKDFRYDTDLQTTEIDFFRTKYVPPDRIRHKINQDVFSYQYTQVGRIETGDFPEETVRIGDYYVYTSLYAHFVEGKPWPQTAYYTMAFDQINASDLGWGQIPDYDALKTFFAELDDLYEQIDERGYLERNELETQDSWLGSVFVNPILEHDEVFLDIGPDGELLLVDGRHRVAIANILDIETIPVRILARHREWCVFRNDLLNALEDGGSLESKFPLLHPEFSHIEHRYDPKSVADCVTEHIDNDAGLIVEYDPGVSGELLFELERRGYETTAFVPDTAEERYFEWYSEYSDIEVPIYGSLSETNVGEDVTLLVFEPVDLTAVSAFIERVQPAQILTNLDRELHDRFDDQVAVFDVEKSRTKFRSKTTR